MSDKIKWGIIGTGSIAHKMAKAIKSQPDALLAAVASRTNTGAEKFGKEFDIPVRYAGYHKLAHDPDIDIIYIATPHNSHFEDVMMCLDHGKPVICEKPITINAKESEELAAFAEKQNLFLMEAMWTRFLPVVAKAKKIVDARTIGDIRMMTVNFSFRCGWDPTHRLLNPELAGGGLLDVGVYCVSFAQWFLGKPSRIVSMAEIGKTGVDEQNACVLGYDNGALAVLSSGVRTHGTHEAFISGTEGTIRLPGFWHGTEMTLSVGGKEESFSMPYGDNGFEFEVQEAMKCLREGKTQSDIMPMSDSIAVLKTMDSMRAEWGLKYPGE